MELTDEEVRLIRVSRFGRGAHILGVTVLPLQGESPIQKALIALGGDSSDPGNNEVRLFCSPKGAYAFLHSLDNQDHALQAADLVKIPQSTLNLEDPLGYMHFILNPKNGEPYDRSVPEKKWLFAGAKKNFLEEMSLKLKGLCQVKLVHWSLLSAMQGLLEGLREGDTKVVLMLMIGSDSSWAVVANPQEIVAVRSLSIGTKSLGINFNNLDFDHLQNDAQVVSSLERFQREIETFIGFYELENALNINALCFVWPQESALPLSHYFKDKMGLKILSIDLLGMLQKKSIVVDNKDSFIPLGENGLAIISSILNT